ncbi:MAG: dTDP-4-dehydrorhamnose 3,5-epimerase family protein [Candidatus Omnitrophota bacterium]
MKVAETNLKGVLMIHPPTVFEDFRGSYVELYNSGLYRESGINVNFIQDDISISTKHVLRGIHGDNETWKLISCLYGEFYFVVANCDKESSDFGKWQSFTLSDKNHTQILVPPKYGNAHLVLSDRAVFHYKQTTYYNPSGQFTYKWDDPGFNIRWPVKNPILSKRDELGHFV